MKSNEELRNGAEIPVEEEGQGAAEEAAKEVEGAEEAAWDAEAETEEAACNAEEAEAEDAACGADAACDAEAETCDAEAAEEAAEATEAESGDGMQAKYMRLMADFQNYKRRTESEKKDIYAYANEKLILPVLDVLDNFERALEQGTSDKKFAEGMELILTQLNGALSKAGLAEIDALGADFDPNFHSAVLMEDTDEYESGKVSYVIQKGYTLNGKVIRPSMVKVAN